MAGSMILAAERVSESEVVSNRFLVEVRSPEPDELGPNILT